MNCVMKSDEQSQKTQKLICVMKLFDNGEKKEKQQKSMTFSLLSFFFFLMRRRRLMVLVRPGGH